MRERRRAREQEREKERGRKGERGWGMERKLEENPWRVRDDRLGIIYTLLETLRFFRNGFQLCLQIGRVSDSFNMRAREGSGNGHWTWTLQPFVKSF